MDLVLVPLADGRWLGLTLEQLRAALEAGADAMPTCSAPTTVGGQGPHTLLTAKQMAERSGVPASWWMKQARERRIEHQLVGKYVRFDPALLKKSGVQKVLK
jgi:hypothetical protein